MMSSRTPGIVALLFGLAASSGHSQTVESPRQVVDSIIAAHGGMDKWAWAPTVSFEVEMTPAGQPQGMLSRVTVEQGRRRTYHEMPALSARMAWDGERAWSENWKLPFPPRFLALLHYYFANLPWLTRDPGVRLASEGTAKLPGDATQYRTVRMTFDEGVGDSPRDYYVLYVHPATRRLRALEYIVTYAGALPEGMSSSPPNLLLYQEHATVDGLVVPTRYEIFQKEGHKPVATVAVRDWSFSRPFDAARLTRPPGGVVDTSSPVRRVKQ
jgi:hypothetical protein